MRAPTHIFFYWHWGVGMSALARLCFNLRHVVYGYDRYPSDITKALVAEGIKVIHDNSLDALPDFLYKKHVRVIYSSAIALSHPQLMFYKKTKPYH